jgi:uncharacterized membrane protein
MERRPFISEDTWIMCFILGVLFSPVFVGLVIMYVAVWLFR